MNKTASMLAFLAAPLIAPAAHAVSELDLAVSADAVGLEYSFRNDDRGSQWGLGAMYNDDVNATLLSAAFNVVGQASANGEVYTGLGFKAAVHETFQTAASLGLGGFVQYQPVDFYGLGLEAQLYYAPEILNSNDADAFYEARARVTYAIHPQAKVFAGWTNIAVEYDDTQIDEVDIEQAFNLGFSLVF